MARRFTLEEHPDDHMLYIRESSLDSFQPIRHIFWYPTGWQSSVYCAYFGTHRLGKLLVPVAGESHTFRFKDEPGAGYLSIDSNTHCAIKTYEKEKILPPAIKERYQGLIVPEWHDGQWMYFYAKGKYEWRLITKGHIKQQSQANE